MEIDKGKIEDIDQRSHFFQEVLEKIPAWIFRRGNTVFLFIFVLFILGLWLIKYPDVIVSDVKILTETPSISVYCPTNGKVTHILKEDHTFVKTGDWVIILENGANHHHILALESILTELDSANFWTKIDSIQLIERMSLGELNEDYLSFFRNVNEYQLFQQLNPQFWQINLNADRKHSLGEIIKNLEDQEQLLIQELNIIQLDYERTKVLHEQKILTKIDLEVKEKELINVKSRLAQIKSTSLNTKLQIDGVKKENSTLVIQQSDRYFELRNNILNSFNNLFFLIEEWKQNYVLKAPTSGELNFYDIRHSQEFLKAEQVVFSVTPTRNQTYWAFAKMPVANSGKVKIGQDVNLKLFNYPPVEFGLLKGKIETITDITQDGMYALKISLPNQLITSSGKIIENKFELLGTAEIITKDISLFNRMFNFLRSKND